MKCCIQFKNTTIKNYFISIFFSQKYSFEINHWQGGGKKVIWDEGEQNKLHPEEGAVGSGLLPQAQQKARGALAKISLQPAPGQADTLTPPREKSQLPTPSLQKFTAWPWVLNLIISRSHYAKIPWQLCCQDRLTHGHRPLHPLYAADDCVKSQTVPVWLICCSFISHLTAPCHSPNTQCCPGIGSRRLGPWQGYKHAEPLQLSVHAMGKMCELRESPQLAQYTKKKGYLDLSSMLWRAKKSQSRCTSIHNKITLLLLSGIWMETWRLDEPALYLMLSNTVWTQSVVCVIAALPACKAVLQSETPSSM